MLVFFIGNKNKLYVYNRLDEEPIEFILKINNKLVIHESSLLTNNVFSNKLIREIYLPFGIHDIEIFVKTDSHGDFYCKKRYFQLFQLICGLFFYFEEQEGFLLEYIIYPNIEIWYPFQRNPNSPSSSKVCCE